jgi:hypothetical protein
VELAPASFHLKLFVDIEVDLLEKNNYPGCNNKNKLIFLKIFKGRQVETFNDYTKLLV